MPNEELPSQNAPGPPPSIQIICCMHAGEPAVAYCHMCGRPICQKCLRRLGYLCSIECRRQADMNGVTVPVYEDTEGREAKKKHLQFKLAFTGVVLLAFGLVALYVWYHVWGRKPSVHYSVKLTAAENAFDAPIFEFIGPRQLLVVREGRVTLYDVARRRESWTRDLAAYAPKPRPRAAPSTDAAATSPAPAEGAGTETAPAKAAEGDIDGAAEKTAESFFVPPDPQGFRRSSDTLWVAFADRVVGFDLQSGAERKNLPLAAPTGRISVGDRSVISYSYNASGEEVVARLDLASGKSDSVQFPPLSQPEAEAPAPPPTTDDLPTNEGNPPPLKPIERERQLLDAGSNLAELEVKLLEGKITTREAIKPVDKAKLDNPNQTVSNSGELAKDLMNEIQRQTMGGTEQEDESRYAVTLKRHLGGEVPVWGREVQGPPRFFALSALDLLVAGRTLIALDKQNQKLWETRLAFPIADPAENAAPCLETDGALYFYDRGVLSAIEARSGAVKWRMPSVGVSHIESDGKGNLYVTTTNASHETIQYTQDTGAVQDGSTVILKVEAATGKVRWKIARVGNGCHPAGKYLYATQTQVSHWNILGNILQKGVNSLRESTPVHFRVYRINPRNGKLIWEYYQKRNPLGVAFQDNVIAVLYPDELQVLKYLTF